MKYTINPIIILLFFYSFACARFKIEELQPSKIASVPISFSGSRNTKGTLDALKKENVPYNFPIRPVTDGDFFYISDPVKKQVRVFSASSGKLEKIIGTIGIDSQSDVITVSFPNQIPNWIAPDGNGGVFIEFKAASIAPVINKQKAGKKKDGKEKRKPKDEIVPPEKRLPGIFDTSDRTILSSVIIFINDDNKIEYTIYKSDNPRIKFFQIFRMDADKEGNIYVCHKEKGKKILSVFQKGKLIKNYEHFLTYSDEDSKNTILDIEKIAPIENSEQVIASVVFRDKNNYRPLFRKIFKIKNPSTKPELMYQTDEKDDFFGWSRADGGFYILNTEDNGAGILFKIFNKDGIYINNRLIRFPGLRESWRGTYVTYDGRITTSRLYHGNFELYEWK